MKKHLPEGHTETLYAECITGTQNRMCTPWTTVLLQLQAILLADFHIVWKRNGRRWKNTLDRGQCTGESRVRHSTGVRQEHNVSSVMVIEPFKPKTVEWSCELARGKRIFSPWYMAKQVHHVLSLRSAVLGNFSHILGIVDEGKCRGELVGKWVMGFGLYCA